MNLIEQFMSERDRLNNKILKFANKNIQKFYHLDLNNYEESNGLDKKTKELIGLACSMTFRGDDCVKFHMIGAYNEGANKDEILEAISIALMIGGSIAYPKVRQAIVFLEELESIRMFSALKETIQPILKENKSRNTLLQKICEALAKDVFYYYWVGFYLVKDEGVLALGPFVGDESPHKEIKFTEGICGQVARKQKTLVVPDVTKEKDILYFSNYVKSEIVIPIFNKKGFFAGVLDIDSFVLDPFTEHDIEFLEELCSQIGEFMD